jgi:hypothetical protein
MPVETIKCQECGSADVTEFKPGTYICAHCESVFKVVDPSMPSHTLCSCGTVVVGRCTDCGIAVCGHHSALWHDERRLCRGCLEKEQEALREASRVRVHTEKIAHATAREAWDTRVKSLMATQSLPSQVCQVMRVATRASPQTGGELLVRPDLLFRLLPDLFPAPLQFEADNAPWSDDEIALWFSKASMSPPQPLEGPKPEGRSRGPKRTSILGWTFPWGSTRVERVSSGTYSMKVGVSADGRRLFAHGNAFGFLPWEPIGSSFREADRFNGITLSTMADMACLQALPDEP